MTINLKPWSISGLPGVPLPGSGLLFSANQPGNGRSRQFSRRSRYRAADSRHHIPSRFWKLASPEQRAEFAGLFRSYVLASYGSRFRDYADRTLRVTGARPADEDVIVESLVEGGATPVRLDWRLARAGQDWLVLDVAVEGVSLLLTYRNEFAAVIERQGGAVAALLDELRRRVAARQPPSVT